MVLELPDEIWLNIVGWIPDDEAIHLATVNRLFRVSAAKIQYRYVRVKKSGLAYKVAKLQHMQRSNHVQHVRCLDIDMNFLSSKEASVKLPWGQYVYHTTAATGNCVIFQRLLHVLLLHVAQHAKNLDELILRWHSGLEFHLQAEFLYAFWPLVRKSLKSLSLLILPMYFDTVALNARKLDSLQRLKLHLDFPPATRTPRDGGFDTFTHFLDSVKGSLRSFEVSWASYPYRPAIVSGENQVNIPPLPPMDGLNEISIQAKDPSCLDIAQFANFLARHDNQFTRLDFMVNQPRHITSLFSRLSFSALTFLNLTTIFMQDPVIDLLRSSYFPLHRLRSFTFSGQFLSTQQMLVIACAFTLSPLSAKNTQLLQLGLQVDKITPALLDVLSQRYPSLLTLSIHHHTKPSGGFRSQMESEFSNAMANRQYSDWTVRTLYVAHFSYPDSRDVAVYDPVMTRTIANSIPRVQMLASSFPIGSHDWDIPKGHI